MIFMDSNELTLASVSTDIWNVLKAKFDVQEHASQKFFGLDGLLDARGLVYLVYILENQYDIVFNPEDMEDKRFYTVDGMAEIVYSKLC